MANKSKFRDIDISKLVTDDTEVRSDQSPEIQNEWRNVVSNPTKWKSLFVSQNLCPYYRYHYGLVKEKETERFLDFQWHYPYEGAI